ncbi:MAG: HD domain-containing phosphohydrolase, partial [Candidatus Scalindua sp.]
MLITHQDESITQDGNDWKPGEVEITNMHFNNKASLETIGIALTSVFNHEKLFKIIISLTNNMLRSKYASLMLIDGDRLRLKYSNHLPEEIMEKTSVKVGVGISGWVALKGLPLLVKDIESGTRFLKRNSERYSSKSFISIPLIVSEKIIGVINVNDKNNDELFNESDLSILKVIAKYSAIAIRNATLIAKTNKLTIARQLDRDYYDSSSKYLPVTFKSLKLGPFSKSELYLENNKDGNKKYVLYWKGGDRLFINEKREEFIRKNIDRLYVPKNGRKQYLRFMETNLQRVIEDGDSSPKEKYDVVKDVAINIISDLNATPEEVYNVERSKQWINNILELISSTRNNYADLMNAKSNDQYLYGHSINITMTSLIFAYHMGMNIKDLSEFGLGLLLQDIGMGNVDPLIFNKPDKLNNEEFAIIRKHAEIGFHMLQETGKVSSESCLLALLHHENYNGSGYPYGLKGNDINYYGRISRIVDVYNAITSDRPYARAKTSDDACQIMEKDMKGMFDFEILGNFTDFLKSVRSVTETSQ